MCFRGVSRVVWGVFFEGFLWVFSCCFVGAPWEFCGRFGGRFAGFLWAFCGCFVGVMEGVLVGRLCALCGVFLRIMAPEVGIGLDRRGSEGSDIGSR